MSSAYLNRLTIRDVDFINSLPDEPIVVFKNTVGIDKEAIKMIKPTIKIRIIGGLDEKEKPKYDSEKYFERTIYSPIEVYKIIEKMEAIESGIEPGWNDLDKAMFIYKQICENIEYDFVDKFINGRDYCRNLLGFLRGQSVCAGFSMMYKEMLERQGIKCIYQNKQHGHAWNLIEINGRMIPVDLTFDVGHKSKDGKCKFAFFGINYDFFDDPNHQATDEEIVKTDLLTDAEFDSSYDKVVRRKKVREEASCYINSRHEKVFYYIMKERSFKRIILQCNGEMKTVLYDESIDDDTAIHFDYYDLEGSAFIFTTNPENKDIMTKLNNNCEVFKRKDGSSFILRAADVKERNVISHDYITFENQSIITIDKIYSDDNLADTPKGYKDGIANILLSKQRVKSKIDNFRGYVGYLGYERGKFQKYYSYENERAIAGIVR